MYRHKTNRQWLAVCSAQAELGDTGFISKLYWESCDNNRLMAGGSASDMLLDIYKKDPVPQKYSSRLYTINIHSDRNPNQNKPKPNTPLQ